jgi:hypothetical protein
MLAPLFTGVGHDDATADSRGPDTPRDLEKQLGRFEHRSGWYPPSP